MRTVLGAVLASVSLVALGGCAAPLVVGAAATAGYVGLQERPASRVASDTDIKVRIKDLLTQQNFSYFSDVGIDVFYGNVLLTGVLPTQADGEQVLKVVQSTPGVKKVYNELFIGAAYSAGQRAKDAWITAQIQPRLIGTQGVFPLNYLITVTNSHVYIIGSCNTPDERNNVLHLLRTTRGVVQVHDYLVLSKELGEAPAQVDANGNPLPTDRRQPNPFPEDMLAH